MHSSTELNGHNFEVEERTLLVVMERKLWTCCHCPWKYSKYALQARSLLRRLFAASRSLLGFLRNELRKQLCLRDPQTCGLTLHTPANPIKPHADVIPKLWVFEQLSLSCSLFSQNLKHRHLNLTLIAYRCSCSIKRAAVLTSACCVVCNVAFHCVITALLWHLWDFNDDPKRALTEVAY